MTATAPSYIDSLAAVSDLKSFWGLGPSDRIPSAVQATLRHVKKTLFGFAWMNIALTRTGSQPYLDEDAAAERVEQTYQDMKQHGVLRLSNPPSLGALRDAWEYDDEDDRKPGLVPVLPQSLSGDIPRIRQKESSDMFPVIRGRVRISAIRRRCAEAESRLSKIRKAAARAPRGKASTVDDAVSQTQGEGWIVVALFDYEAIGELVENDDVDLDGTMLSETFGLGNQGSTYRWDGNFQDVYQLWRQINVRFAGNPTEVRLVLDSNPTTKQLALGSRLYVAFRELETYGIRGLASSMEAMILLQTQSIFEIPLAHLERLARAGSFYLKDNETCLGDFLHLARQELRAAYQALDRENLQKSMPEYMHSIRNALEHALGKYYTDNNIKHDGHLRKLLAAVIKVATADGTLPMFNISQICLDANDWAVKWATAVLTIASWLNPSIRKYHCHSDYPIRNVSSAEQVLSALTPPSTRGTPVEHDVPLARLYGLLPEGLAQCGDAWVALSPELFTPVTMIQQISWFQIAEQAASRSDFDLGNLPVGASQIHAERLRYGLLPFADLPWESIEDPELRRTTMLQFIIDVFHEDTMQRQAFPALMKDAKVAAVRARLLQYFAEDGEQQFWHSYGEPGQSQAERAQSLLDGVTTLLELWGNLAAFGNFTRDTERAMTIATSLLAKERGIALPRQGTYKHSTPGQIQLANDMATAGRAVVAALTQFAEASPSQTENPENDVFKGLIGQMNARIQATDPPPTVPPPSLASSIQAPAESNAWDDGDDGDDDMEVAESWDVNGKGEMMDLDADGEAEYDESAPVSAHSHSPKLTQPSTSVHSARQSTFPGASELPKKRAASSASNQVRRAPPPTRRPAKQEEVKPQPALDVEPPVAAGGRRPETLKKKSKDAEAGTLAKETQTPGAGSSTGRKPPKLHAKLPPGTFKARSAPTPSQAEIEISDE